MSAPSYILWSLRLSHTNNFLAQKPDRPQIIFQGKVFSPQRTTGTFLILIQIPHHSYEGLGHAPKLFFEEN